MIGFKILWHSFTFLQSKELINDWNTKSAEEPLGRDVLMGETELLLGELLVFKLLLIEC